MKRKKSGRLKWVLIIVLFLGAAILAGYLVGKETLREKPEDATPQEKAEAVKEAGPPPVKAETPDAKEPVVTEKIQKEIPAPLEEKKPVEPEDYCAEVEEDILEFFRYLDTKPYIRHLENGANTYDQFKGRRRH
jgi:hypothetical protein